MIAAWVLLAGMCLSAGVALVRGSLVAAVGLSVLSAIWLPYSNGRIEGPVLISLDREHGLTLMDLVAYAGLAVALAVCLASPRIRLRLPVAGICCLTVAAGLAAAYFVWSGPTIPPPGRAAPRSGHAVTHWTGPPSVTRRR